ncbi:hypothetical protein FB451DRAFT_1236014 [Mycena latifolia]|nr:hypothetical protein FB451DRAFT_1236014 [Mycena latifolia]
MEGAQRTSEASRLNYEAKTLFNEGKFREAGKLYQAANRVDTLNSPIYLSNLALVQLKLKKYTLAENSATMALVRDPRFSKARYRRALARRGQGRLMESLVDLANVLTAEPMDNAAIAAFAAVQAEHEDLGPNRGSLSSMAILEANYPPAYGSAAVALRPVSREPPGGGIVIPNSSRRIPNKMRTVCCAWCKTAKLTREIKTCRGCQTASYCDQVCQRKHWASHKKECTRYEYDDTLAMHLSRTLLDHKFFRTNLLIYAMRAIGALHHLNPPYLTVLLVFVNLVTLAPGRSARQRVSLTHMVTAPLAVFDKVGRDSYLEQLQVTRDACEMPNAPGVAIVITPHLKKGRESDRSRSVTFMHRVVPDLVKMATQTIIPIGIQSHSFGTARIVTSDLDKLYWILQDELANDADNYYGLQR